MSGEGWERGGEVLHWPWDEEAGWGSGLVKGRDSRGRQDKTRIWMV